jgi:hypothetical protein
MQSLPRAIIGGAIFVFCASRGGIPQSNRFDAPFFGSHTLMTAFTHARLRSTHAAGRTPRGASWSAQSRGVVGRVASSATLKGIDARQDDSLEQRVRSTGAGIGVEERTP